MPPVFPTAGYSSSAKLVRGASGTHPSAAPPRRGTPFVARRAVNLHGCALPHCAPLLRRLRRTFPLRAPQVVLCGVTRSAFRSGVGCTFPVRGLTTRREIGENAFLRAGGGVAQLGEHHVRNVGVEGSIPFSSTTFLFRRKIPLDICTWFGGRGEIRKSLRRVFIPLRGKGKVGAFPPPLRK